MIRALLAAVLLAGCGAAGSPPSAADSQTPSASFDVRADCAERGGRYLVATNSCLGGRAPGEAVDATPRPLPTPRPTARPTPVARDDLMLLEQGFTYFPESTEYVHFAVVFENPNAATWVAERTSITITWFDAAEGVAGSTTEILSTALPGGRSAVAGVAFNVTNPATMDVQFRVGDWTEIDFAPGAFTFSGVTTEAQQFGGSITRGLVASTFEVDQEFVRVAAVYKDANGSVLGGDSGFIDFVPAGGEIGFEVNPLGGFQGVATTDVYASP